MKYIYISSLTSKTKYNEISTNSNSKPLQSVQKFHRLICEGLKENGKDLCIISSIPMSRKISKKIFWFDKKEVENTLTFEYLPFINFKVLRQITTIISINIALIKKIITSDTKDICFICDVLNKTIFISTKILSTLFRKKCVAIVTDLPSYVGVKETKLYLNMLNNCSGYIFLTEYMNKRINVNNKPYIIMEGIVDNNINIETSKKYKINTLMYAGGLFKKYGIVDLILAVEKLDNVELHLYGYGELEEYLKTEKFKNTKYLGNVANEVIVKEEQKCTLLVNPRSTNEDYTKYSFPSKNMEYMLSGTPVLTTPLLGMPIEYYKHVYILKELSVNGICKALTTILKKDKKELVRKGQDAQQFVLKNKNKVIQSKRIIGLIDRIYKG